MFSLKRTSSSLPIPCRLVLGDHDEESDIANDPCVNSIAVEDLLSRESFAIAHDRKQHDSHMMRPLIRVKFRAEHLASKHMLVHLSGKPSKFGKR